MVAIRIGATALVAASVVGLVARQLGSSNQTLIIIAAFTPCFLVPAFLSMLAFVLTRSRLGVTLSGLVLIALVLTQAPLFLSNSATSPDASRVPRTLVLMTGNLGLGAADASAVLSQATTHDVDLLALQEVTGSALDGLRTVGIDTAFPYSVVAPGPDATGVALWSRLPLRDGEVDDGATMHRVTARVVLDPEHADSGPIVKSLHIVAPWPDAPTKWLGQLAALRPELQSLAGPVIVMGDFNATRDNEQFRSLLVGGYSDAADAAGAGWLPTYPADSRLPPLLAIDHVVSRGLSASSVTTVAMAGSDHRAVIATLAE